MHVTPCANHLFFCLSASGVGLFNPVLSASLGMVYAVGRYIYALGYTSKKGAGEYQQEGPLYSLYLFNDIPYVSILFKDNRVAGAALAGLSAIGLLGSGFYYGFFPLRASLGF